MLRQNQLPVLILEKEQYIYIYIIRKMNTFVNPVFMF